MIQRPAFLLFFVFMVTISFVQAQTPEEFQKEYNRRITQEMLNGVYIPADLEDAFSELERLADPKGIAEFKSAPEDSIRRRLHFGVGRWILINWGFEEGSRISHYLKLKGITLPDDMVEFIIVTWHRRLNGQPLRLDEEIAMIQKRLEEEQKEREAKKVIISKEKKPHKE